MRSDLVYIFISQTHGRQFARNIVFHKYITNNCKLKAEAKMSQTSEGTSQPSTTFTHGRILISVNTIDSHFVTVKKNYRRNEVDLDKYKSLD